MEMMEDQRISKHPLQT